MGAGHLVAGRYLLDEVIGSGGMGTVWRATDQQRGSLVAIKRARSDDVDTTPDQQALRRLRREARIAAELAHPHVVAVLDVVEDDSQWWLVMEYLPARSLAELLQEQGTLQPRRAARLGAQVAGALAAVHARGVQHRDVKPGNVLVAADGTAKLADFGISRVVHGDATQTNTGLIPGTPGFLAPEVADGRDPGTASDVFSLGATLFAAVEGSTPVGEVTNPLAAVRRAAAGQILSPRRAGPLTPVLAALLRIHPGDRPDAAGAARLLRDVARGRVPVVRAGPRQRARRRAVLLSAVIAGALLLSLGWLVFRPAPSSTAAPPGMGDPRTADPCALTDPTPLARFGQAQRDVDYGNFDRCDVIVSAGDEPWADIKVELVNPVDAADEAQGPWPVERVGQLSIVSQPVADDDCDRAVRLPDGYLVSISAQSLGPSPAPLCAMAEVATDTAVAVLGQGRIPRRLAPFDDASLGRVDACGLLDADALRAVPGVRAVDAHPGFGNWACQWPGAGSTVRLRFDHDQPLDEDDGSPTRIEGRAGAVKAGADGDCVVRVVHRRYVDADARAAIELMLVTVSGPGSPTQLCGQATTLATAATRGLPAV